MTTIAVVTSSLGRARSISAGTKEAATHDKSVPKQDETGISELPLKNRENLER